VEDQAQTLPFFLGRQALGEGMTSRDGSLSVYVLNTFVLEDESSPLDVGAI